MDSAADIAISLNRFLGEAGRRRVTLEEIRLMVGYGARCLLERAFAATGEPVPEEVVEAGVPRFLELYRTQPTVESRPYPGVEATLGRLAVRGCTLAVCTNKSEALSRRVLAELGLDRYFAAIAGGDTFPWHKPDSRHLSALLGALGVDPDDAVLVGDSGVDVRAARGAGVRVVAVTYGYARDPEELADADAAIGRMEALIDVLDAMGSPDAPDQTERSTPPSTGSETPRT